jgi:predicted nucleic acid-binding protein
MIVLDTSAAIEIAMSTHNGKALLSLIEPNEKVISSTLMRSEAANAFWKYVKAGVLTKVQSLRYLRIALSLVTEMHDTGENCIESFSEAVRLEHPAYDLFYLTLARRYGATLFTLDKKLIRLCESNGVDVVHSVRLD